jgi:hypothetical protein
LHAVNRPRGVDIGWTPGEDTAVFRLLPREEKFFDLFEQQATHIVSAARTPSRSRTWSTRATP